MLLPPLDRQGYSAATLASMWHDQHCLGPLASLISNVQIDQCINHRAQCFTSSKLQSVCRHSTPTDSASHSHAGRSFVLTLPSPCNKKQVYNSKVNRSRADCFLMVVWSIKPQHRATVTKFTNQITLHKQVRFTLCIEPQTQFLTQPPISVSSLHRMCF